MRIGRLPVFFALAGFLALAGLQAAAEPVAVLALRFGLRSDLAHGVGTALVFFAGVGLMIDGFAERRARPYTAALEATARNAATGTGAPS